MSIKDVIKNSILETIENNTLSMSAIWMTLAIGILFSIYIYVIYYFSQKKSFYNKQFNVVLGVLPIITAGIILAMQSNLIISLGMVGALSIVRFRTAVKEPKDLLFLFWSISAGIIVGARNYALCFAICIVVTIMLFLLELLPEGRALVLIVVNMDPEGKEEDILPVVSQFVKHLKVKTRNRTEDGLDMIIECGTKRERELLEKVSEISHVVSVSVIAHDGEAVY